MRSKLFGRVTVGCWGQEVAGHKDKHRFAEHCCVRCEIWKKKKKKMVMMMMMMIIIVMVAYDEGCDEMCFLCPRL